MITSRLSSTRIALALVLLIVAWGTYLRFANLGLNTLASDEMNHYFVAQSLLESGEPLLPSGTRYTRGLEYSALVAAALPRFDQLEVAVRFPSAVIGTLALGLFAIIAWRVAGPWPAVIATLLLAIYPEGLRLSRFGRFYTLQLLGGVAAFFATWMLVRRPLEPDRLHARRLAGDWGWALFAFLAFAYAASVQLTTLSVGAGAGLFVALTGFGDLSRLGRKAWRWSVPWQLTAMGITVAVFLLVFKFDFMRSLLVEARTVPMWARLSADGPGPVTAYYRALSGHFPLIVSLSPLIFLAAIFQHRRLGGLLLAWFAVPILLHSLVFPWKSERYVLVAIPALLLATGVAAAAAAAPLHRYLDRHFSMIALPSWIGPRGAVATGFAVIAAGVVLTMPAFNTSRRLMTARQSAGWEESESLLQRHPELARLPIGSAQPLVALHYWGRLDFTVQRALLESWSRDSTTGGFDHPYRMKPMGSPDAYAGRPTLTSAGAIRERFADAGSVLIGIDQKYLAYDNIDPSLREVLEREGRELCAGRCGSMLLYHWSFRPPETPAGS